MKQQSAFSKAFHKKYKAIEGGLSFSVEDLHNSSFVKNKIEKMKGLLKKHPIPMEIFNRK